ncbi:MAG: 3-hydroxyacyl-CoA dehydrogenase [Gammaproteobacteria bacterium]|nr:3-hydroxyacyl-CoA dehydrogenase [Gammaproteobacteria bacterium]MBT3859690.1 3-hydroxyacyl-CoA dehydrogenase [Gammaproteobacteria bacterium]MBT3987211.1 3-hydroxyacyl-CoA dehydrogenase [Gammaproteobacteria bacterium]MBT4256750.1 3-hydroxyacyl-CoA dehydrogenase [Gammaproteobacteria bacterium]MBT4581597.1 3-hydroxyacyl-CoA dehydrogenase [Gammaproteobacteria bacterium]
MSEVVSYELIDNIGVISVNNPPVNALAQVVREGIHTAIQSAQQDESEAIVLYCEGRTFIAGADITEFGKPPQEPGLPVVLGAIENSSKAVIAAIHGTALGGGFEVSLACHYRCAIPSAKVGLPEVKLGLLPGAGGTQRAPRIAGVKAALDMITSGNPVGASKALEMGLIDKVIDGSDLKAGALQYAKELVGADAPLRRIRDITIDPSTVEEGYFEAARKQLARRARGQIAQDKIVSCIEAAVELPMDQGLERERELFVELVTSPESAAMRHIFFAERLATKIKDLPKDTPTREINKVAIIGGGTMGGGIAMCFANVGIPVTMLEINDEALARGMGIIEKNYKITVQKGKLPEDQMASRIALINGTTNYEELNDVDLVIEAVFENLELKKEIFAKLDGVCKQGAILASNTSYQDIDQIAAATSRPQDVVGMHFFSPANVMKLLENVRGEKTADDVIATAMKIGKKIGKVCALSRVCYGFIGNRMLGGYGRESQMLLMDGCTPVQVDSALEKFGMAMGPLAMGDLAGLDVGYKARQARTDLPDDPKLYRMGTVLVEMGRHGQKTGSGFYQYDPETRRRMSDPEVEAMIKDEAAKIGVEQREISDEEIIARCLYPLINEGAKILEEGIAQRPSDIDVVYVFGYAFPVAKGGPMHYADQVGLKNVYDKICEYRDRDGEQYWQPAPLLEKLAKEGKTFAQWGREQEAS